MGAKDSVRGMTREFFRTYPDYSFCRTLADNVRGQVTTYAQALQHLARRAQAADLHAAEIQAKLDRRTVTVGQRQVALKSLSLRRIVELEDLVLAQVVGFYFKHPFAHGRTYKSRWLPGWVRTFFLRALLGTARRRGLDLDYPQYFEILELL